MRIATAVFLTFALITTLRADTLRTLDGKLFDGSVRLDPKGGLIVTPKGSQHPGRIEFSQILHVRFDNGDPSNEPTVQDPWTGNDIGTGALNGSQKSGNGQLTVEGGGTNIGGKADSFRFVSQIISGDGEVSAHLVPGGTSRPNIIDGVMLRSSNDPNAQMVAMLISRDGLSMINRDRDGGDARVLASAGDHKPIWLRLVRRDAVVTGYKSNDAKTWSKVAEARLTPIPTMLGGMAVASRDPAMGSAVFDKPRATADEPPGSTVTSLSDLTPLVNRLRKGPAPAVVNGKPVLSNSVMINGMYVQRALVEGTSCEVRYALGGKYNNLLGVPYILDREKSGGTATIEIFADSEKLYDSGPLSFDTPWVPFNVVVTGKKELRILVTDGGKGKTFSNMDLRQVRLVKLSTARQEVKSQTSSIVTTGGSIYSNVDVKSVNKQAVRFTLKDRTDISVPADQVARIYLPGLTQAAIDKLPATSTGVLLTNGDFYEGDIDELADGKVQVSSVIFGPREFGMRRDLLALVLRPPASDAKPADYIVQTSDGSTFMADVLGVDSNKLAVTDRSFGKQLIDARSISEITYGGDKLKWLPDLRPRRIDPARDRTIDGFLVDSTIFGPGLQLVGLDCDRGVSLSNGSSVTYDLDGQYKTLVCVAGVPVEVMPNVSAVFVAESEGKEIFRSPPRNSTQDPLPVSIDTSKLKTITLRVETEKDSNIPVVGLWGDPLLVKAQ